MYRLLEILTAYRYLKRENDMLRDEINLRKELDKHRIAEIHRLQHEAGYHSHG